MTEPRNGWQPERETDILAGTPPGGGLDRTARMLAAALQSNGVACKVVNVPGDGARRVWASVDAFSTVSNSGPWWWMPKNSWSRWSR